MLSTTDNFHSRPPRDKRVRKNLSISHQNHETKTTRRQDNYSSIRMPCSDLVILSEPQYATSKAYTGNSINKALEAQRYSHLMRDSKQQRKGVSPYIEGITNRNLLTKINYNPDSYKKMKSFNETSYNNADDRVRRIVGESLKFQQGLVRNKIQKQKVMRRQLQYGEDYSTMSTSYKELEQVTRLATIDQATKTHYQTKDQPTNPLVTEEQEEPEQIVEVKETQKRVTGRNQMSLQREQSQPLKSVLNKERSASILENNSMMACKLYLAPLMPQGKQEYRSQMNRLSPKQRENAKAIGEGLSKSIEIGHIARYNSIQQDYDDSTNFVLPSITTDQVQLQPTQQPPSAKHLSSDSKLGAVPKSLNNKVKYLDFRPFLTNMDNRPSRQVDKGYYFKFFNPNTDIKLVRYFFEDNGFKEWVAAQNKIPGHQNQVKPVPQSSDDWTILWSCSIMKSNVFQSLKKYQKVNHFPKSFELTRKDFMNERIRRMQEIHGKRNFNFIPFTYVLPKEVDKLIRDMESDKKQWWIFKPAGSAQGKGIFISNNIQDLQIKQSMVASHYINNPYLIDGLKFDLRIYVAITSVNPLRIYIYEEGLARFATCKYSNDLLTKQNRYMHLTNYSINKFNKEAFVQNDNLQKDDFGSKWSLAGLKNVLKNQGVDTEAVFKKIEDIIIKTIISAEPLLNNAFEMYVPYRNNCFELLGFDILIDDKLNPWLLEVNLSPSLSCDSLLDQKIKANLICDLLNMAGVVSLDFRNNKENTSKKGNQAYAKRQELPPEKGSQKGKKKRDSDFDLSFSNIQLGNSLLKKNKDKVILREAEEEFKRKGLFKLIFPGQNFEYYKQFFEEDRPLNLLQHAFFKERGHLPQRS